MCNIVYIFLGGTPKRLLQTTSARVAGTRRLWRPGRAAAQRRQVHHALAACAALAVGAVGTATAHTLETRWVPRVPSPWKLLMDINGV